MLVDCWSLEKAKQGPGAWQGLWEELEFLSGWGSGECGPQSLKYLPSGLSQKVFADP